ncbi:TrmB family transcriptional regulator [Egibacter rhizosphaerae]|uniref:TrmB family transcriptional regulator n=1 Tax=Egibacter rhizosphaerae TaxID=1670831 RepID=A0A411YGN6_9ACTN|nr:helix-turn-helix domain-containing protein [Egibacter rhizosphaerae]QBI20410.1 TrmB family transcriptional regulator [Egibacter rhizosphaerae]
MDDTITERLVELGLTRNEARAYLSLLRHGRRSAAEVAEAAGIPRPKVYEALNALERRGFVRSGGQRVRAFEAVHSEVALPEWVSRRDQERKLEAEREQRLADELSATLPSPPEPTPAPAHTELIDVTEGREETAGLYEDLVARTNRTVDVSYAGFGVRPRERWADAERGALDRGVRVRVLFAPELLDDPARWRPVEEAGGAVRISATFPLKLAIRDGEEALVVLLSEARDGGEGVRTVAIRHPDLVAPLQLLFQQEWRRARAVDTSPDTAQEE